MTYEKYEKRVVAIDKWFDEYIKETFHSVHQFGHLRNYHINKDNAFLMERSKRLKRDISTFVGEERDIVAMLISFLNLDTILFKFNSVHITASLTFDNPSIT